MYTLNEAQQQRLDLIIKQFPFYSWPQVGPSQMLDMILDFVEKHDAEFNDHTLCSFSEE